MPTERELQERHGNPSQHDLGALHAQIKQAQSGGREQARLATGDQRGGSTPAEEPQKNRPQAQVPSIGRIAHYVAYGTPGGEFPAGEHRAAIITETYPVDPTETADVAVRVGLCVLNPSGFFFNRHIPYDGSPTPAPGTWHFPERV